MRKKGFTLVELLVVIAIIAMLLAILMPALAKVKTLAYQMLCGTNLKGIANAILVYSQDNNEKYPVAGGGSPTWSWSGSNPSGKLNQAGNTPLWQWDDTTKPVSTQNRATVSACLYLLVKYADVSPASFVCKAGKQKKLNITASQATTTDARERGTAPAAAQLAKDATDCWDFSNAPAKYCSYAYSYPFVASNPTGSQNFALNSSSKSGMAVAGDLNPWIQGDPDPTWQGGIKSGGGWANRATPPNYDSPQLIKTSDKAIAVSGNSLTHESVGQNILFNDMHAEFSKQPNPDSAIQNDNVYTPWDMAQTNEQPKRQNGIQPTTTGQTNTAHVPQGKEDSYLVQW